MPCVVADIYDLGAELLFTAFDEDVFLTLGFLRVIVFVKGGRFVVFFLVAFFSTTRARSCAEAVKPVAEKTENKAIIIANDLKDFE